MQKADTAYVDLLETISRDCTKDRRTVYLPVDVLCELDRLADKENISTNRFIANIILNYFKLK